MTGETQVLGTETQDSRHLSLIRAPRVRSVSPKRTKQHPHHRDSGNQFPINNIRCVLVFPIHPRPLIIFTTFLRFDQQTDPCLVPAFYSQ